jgi:arginyl-tRNA synthetase
MNIYKKIKSDIIVILKKIAKELNTEVDEKILNRISVENPKEEKYGDISTNSAMVLCKVFRKNPRELANLILEELKKLDYIEKIDIAGAGFINMTLKKSYWQNLLNKILEEGHKYGECNIGKGEKVNVEYVSVNPTGPLHIGHTRGAIFGDALASILKKVGYDVTKEYYINDAGNQIKTLSKSAYLRYLEALGETITIPEGCYPGEYLKPIGQELKKKYGDSLKGKTEDEYIPMIREFVVDKMMNLIKDDMDKMGIHHDVFFSEKKELHDKGAMDETLKFLWDKGLLYKGKLEAPKGKKIENYVAEELTLFKTKQFGDDEDRAVLKADGTPTYLAGDMPYLKNKIDRGFTKLFMILGADHIGYVKRIQAVAKAISEDKAELNIHLTSMVKFVKNGKPIKMSKRAGKFLTARDVVNEVGKDILRFIMLTKQLSSPMEFDFAKVKEQSKDNPVFYVQYAHARCHSVFRKAKEEMGLNIENLKEFDLSLLKDEVEISLIKKLLEYPKILESSAITYEPIKITQYLQELASQFHSLWNLGGDLKFIISDNKELTKARLILIKATANVISIGLTILGVKPLKKME